MMLYGIGSLVFGVITILVTVFGSSEPTNKNSVNTVTYQQQYSSAKPGLIP